MDTNYKGYKVEDFVIDNHFKNWVLHPDHSSNLFWEKWLANNQHRVEDVRQAREILLKMTLDQPIPSKDMEDEVWDHILEALGDEPEQTKVVPLGPDSILNRYPERKGHTLYGKNFLVAASVSLLMLSLALLVKMKWDTADSLETGASVTVKSTLRGQKSIVFLPDGTKVHLNSESTLHYDGTYNREGRVVTLQGEAFFEVVEDVQRPFTVITPQLSTTALGTSFNVSAYLEEQQEISLITGKVKVQGADGAVELLAPGELVVLDDHQQMHKRSFEIATQALWRKGTILFQDTPLDEVITELERWYDVEFQIKNRGDRVLQCTGRFDHDYLSNVLNSLGFALDFTHRVDGKEVIIDFKTKK